MRDFTGVLALSCIAAATLSGCTRPQDRPATDTAAGPAAAASAPAPAPISPADVAGRWSMRSVSQTGDSTIATYELIATADPSGWRLNVPGGQPIPVRITTAGDSIVTEAGPFESTVRKGTQVTLHGVLRLEAGRLAGTTVARFAGGSPDSLRVRTEGTRKP